MTEPCRWSSVAVRFTERRCNDIDTLQDQKANLIWPFLIAGSGGKKPNYFFFSKEILKEEMEDEPAKKEEKTEL